MIESINSKTDHREVRSSEPFENTQERKIQY